MGKQATPTGNATIRLADGTLSRIEVGKAVTLTDAEYAALDTATKALLPTPATVADPSRGTVTPTPVKTPLTTTALRPTAASAGIGAMLYDQTLGLPIWSNGTAWRNAAGVTV